MADETAHLDLLRTQLLKVALAHAPFEGWTQKTLAKAETDAGLPRGTAELVCPAGAVDLLDFWGLVSDESAVAAIGGLDLQSLKVRQRVRAGVLARLAAIGPEHREAARRAAARLALPDAGARGPRILWRAADAIWRAIGDRSTDGNYYSKRVILAGVLASTFAIWIEGGDEQGRVEAFLDRRIDNVMAFEKAKAQARTRLEGLPDPLGVLARLRFGR
jgi:ubiquinone biosynthesis protein COQ9